MNAYFLILAILVETFRQHSRLDRKHKRQLTRHRRWHRELIQRMSIYSIQHNSVKHTLFDVTVDSESALIISENSRQVKSEGSLSSSQCADHDETSAGAAKEAADTELTSHAGQARDHALSRLGFSLVDFGEQRVGGLGDEGGGETGDETGAQVELGEGGWRQGLLGFACRGDGLLEDNLIHSEFGHCVRDL